MQLEITFKTGHDVNDYKAPRDTIICSLESLESNIVEIGDEYEIIGVRNLDEDSPNFGLIRNQLFCFPWKEVFESSDLSQHETITEIISASFNHQEDYCAEYLDWLQSCYPSNPTYKNFRTLMIDIYENWEDLGQALYQGYDSLEGSELYPYVDWEAYALDYLANNSNEVDYFEFDRSLVLMRVEE